MAVNRNILGLTLLFCGCAVPESKTVTPPLQDSIIPVVAIESPTLVLHPTMDSLLENPLDLEGFKAKYGPTNSGGGCEVDEYLNLPDTLGFTYQYFLFHKLNADLPEKRTERELFSQFIITVFKYGETVGNFFDTNESLLMLECHFNNPPLGALNVQGKTKDELVGEFGEPTLRTEENWCYLNAKNNCLSLHFSDDQVIWWKYVKLSETIDLSQEVPPFLKRF